jgi:hypothetical protein
MKTKVASLFALATTILSLVAFSKLLGWQETGTPGDEPPTGFELQYGDCMSTTCNGFLLVNGSRHGDCRVAGSGCTGTCKYCSPNKVVMMCVYAEALGPNGPKNCNVSINATTTICGHMWEWPCLRFTHQCNCGPPNQTGESTDCVIKQCSTSEN